MSVLARPARVLSIVALAASLIVLAPITTPSAQAATCTQYQYSYGGTGSCVTYIQRMLNGLSKNTAEMLFGATPAGKQIAVDGQWGRDTEDLVDKVQRNIKDSQGRSLSVDHVVGPRTWDAMCARILNKDTVGVEAWYDARDAAQRAGCAFR